MLANFLLAPLHAGSYADIRVLGSYSVLDWSKLDDAQRKAFDDLPQSASLPGNDALGKTLLEPHPSWMTRLTEAWAKRYVK